MFIHNVTFYDGRKSAARYWPRTPETEGGKNGATRVTGVLQLPLSFGRVSADNPVISIYQQDGTRLMAEMDVLNPMKIPGFWWTMEVSGLIPLPTSEQLFAIVDARGRAFTDASGRVLLARNE